MQISENIPSISPAFIQLQHGIIYIDWRVISCPIGCFIDEYLILYFKINYPNFNPSPSQMYRISEIEYDKVYSHFSDVSMMLTHLVGILSM